MTKPRYSGNEPIELLKFRIIGIDQLGQTSAGMKKCVGYCLKKLLKVKKISLS